MDQLYQAHFGLQQAPFNVSPDPAFLYLSESHREALAQLTYGINARKGFVVLTGEVGTGKTTLIHALMSELSQATHTALLFNMVVSPIDLLRYVCEEFKLVELGEPRKELHDYTVMLNEFLLESYRVGENCALIIDEAQNLSAEVLEGVRLLSNFETSRDKLLQILLVGQPEFAVRLNAMELRQLKQRVTLRHHLRALTLSECREYISSRVKTAGGDPKLFSEKALEAVQTYSGGIPRLVNILCDNGLLTAFALGKAVVESDVVAEVAKDLQIIVDRNGLSTNLRRVADYQATNKGMVSARDMAVSNPRLPTRLDASRRVSERSDISQGKPPASIVNPAIAENGMLAPSANFVVQARPVEALRPMTVTGSGVPITNKVFESIVESLTDSMGPMASVILREQVQRMNGDLKNFPQDKLATLIEGLSEEIFDADVRDQFRQRMLAYVQSLG